MADLAYREVYSMNPIEARKLLIKTYQQTKSIRKTSRASFPLHLTLQCFMNHLLLEFLPFRQSRGRISKIGVRGVYVADIQAEVIAFRQTGSGEGSFEDLHGYVILPSIQRRYSGHLCEVPL